MKNKVIALILSACFFLSACGAKAPEQLGLDEPVKPVDNLNTKETKEYTEGGEKATVIREYAAPDGLCNIKVTDAYFDVTLNEEDAIPFEVGLAYGAAVKEVCPNYAQILEPYLFDSIRSAFSNLDGNYKAVEVRTNTLFAGLDNRYKQEIDGFAKGIGATGNGIAQDGVLTETEVKLAQIGPDCLRQTACSGLSLWGQKTYTGDTLAVRCLEWLLGKDKSICTLHTVLHVRNKDKSFTSIGFLGMLNVVSGINDNGLFAAILDVDTKREYACENKACYSFAVRHILEEYDNATDAGNYMVDNSENFTFSHNVMLTDGKHSYCAEDTCEKRKDDEKGYSVLRDNKTPLMKDLKWDNPDSLCIVNAYVTENNYDAISGNAVNAVKFAKYNRWVAERDKFSMTALKDMMTQEVVDSENSGSKVVENVHSKYLTQMILLDYHQGSVQAAFTGVDGVTDKPVFYEIAEF